MGQCKGSDGGAEQASARAGLRFLASVRVKMVPEIPDPQRILLDAELLPQVPEPHIMGMPHAFATWTADRVRALPDDGKRYETVNGELLVTPAPGVPHQRAVGELGFLLRTCLRTVSEVEVLASPADIELDEITLVQPDLFVTRWISGPSPTWKSVKLLLAIEVLSPSTARYDRVTKRSLYQRQGIEYWIVDLDGRLVERWHPEDERPEIVTGTMEWKGHSGLPSCRLDLESFFAGVLAD